MLKEKEEDWHKGSLSAHAVLAMAQDVDSSGTDLENYDFKEFFADFAQGKFEPVVLRFVINGCLKNFLQFLKALKSQNLSHEENCRIINGLAKENRVLVTCGLFHFGAEEREFSEKLLEQIPK